MKPAILDFAAKLTKKPHMDLNPCNIDKTFLEIQVCHQKELFFDNFSELYEGVEISFFMILSVAV